MALKGNLLKNNPSNSYRVDIKNAYFKIDDLFIDLTKERVRLNIRGYASDYARHNFATGLYKKTVHVPLKQYEKCLCTKDELLKESYTYLKTLDEFKDFEDHLIEYKGSIDFNGPIFYDTDTIKIDENTTIDENTIDKI